MWEREVNRGGGKGWNFGGKQQTTATKKKKRTKPLKTQHKPNTHIEESKPRTYVPEPRSHARQGRDMGACPTAGKVTKAKAAVRGVPAFGIAVLRLHRMVMFALDRTRDHD